jgi:hypothetical protein
MIVGEGDWVAYGTRRRLAGLPQVPVHTTSISNR